MSPEEVTKRTAQKSILDALTQLEIEETSWGSKFFQTLSARNLETQKQAMLDLVILSTSTGYGGRTVLDIGPHPSRAASGRRWTPCFKARDIAKLATQPRNRDAKPVQREGGAETSDAARPPNSEGPVIRVFVLKVESESLSVVTEQASPDELPEGRLWLTKLIDTAVTRRMRWAVGRINYKEPGLVAQLMRGDAQAKVAHDAEAVKTCISSSRLNEPQKNAVAHAVGSNLSVIHGPPGTGKTSTLVEIICQLVKRGERVLVCGPSNISVDNIVERLSEVLPASNENLNILRLGHPARLSPGALAYSYDIVTSEGNDAEYLRELKHGMKNALAAGLYGGPYVSSRKAFKLLKRLRKEYKAREKEMRESMITSAKVVAATLHGAGARTLTELTFAKPLFSTIIIDEVSQALLPQCYIPAVIDMGVERLIVTGDNKQLPPVVTSNAPATVETLGTTLFDVLVATHGAEIKHFISIQYRMYQEIMDFPSTHMYDGKLVAHESVARRRLTGLNGVGLTSVTGNPTLWIDTRDADCPEVKDKNESSTKNPGEASKVVAHVHALRQAGVKATDIGVIAPYRAQVGHIRSLLSGSNAEVEVSTVDGFQGREKEAIVLSMVRSNDTAGKVGFVSDSRRINVAMTRPRRHLCVIGNSETLGGESKDTESILPQWIEYCTNTFANNKAQKD